MKRIHILVEGQTEETFARDILRAHFLSQGAWLSYSIVATKRTKKGTKFKGGVTTYKTLQKEIQLLLINTSLVAVTTMIDYYGIPDDFPGKNTLQGKTCFDKVAYLEKACQIDINHRHFIPYLALHEFEALLFSDPLAIATAFSETNVEQKLVSIRNSYSSPEEINDDPKTHPAARILA